MGTSFVGTFMTSSSSITSSLCCTSMASAHTRCFLDGVVTSLQRSGARFLDEEPLTNLKALNFCAVDEATAAVSLTFEPTFETMLLLVLGTQS